MLWDVDYTLVNASGIGRHLYRLAFAELYDRELPERANEADMAGRTDRAIALDVLALAGVSDPRADVAAFESALARLAPGLAGLVASSAKALPGAAASLATLAALDGGDHHADGWPAGTALQSLLTGNVRPLAEVKLAPLGLTDHLDLDVGAYGDEHEVRAELVHLARQRATLAYGRDFGGETTVIIGDTPLDVAAGLAAGARTVGVASGFFSSGELTAAGAHAVLPDLTDTAAVLTAVLAIDPLTYQP